MCGRYTNRLTWRDIVELYRITEPEIGPAQTPNLRPRYNVAPTQEVGIVRPADAGRQYLLARWGLVPSWAKDLSISAKMINARCETVREKPAYRSAFKSRRCLIPADGFYEWQAQEKEPKQPFHFSLKSGQGFAFAGLWESWKTPEGDELISCTIVTCDANDLVRPVHGRMPVILPQASYDHWISAPADEAAELMTPFPSDEMHAVAVSRTVNSVKNDGPECIEPAQETGTLFPEG